MTMVATCLFKEGAVMIADSRATKEKIGSPRIYSDTLQKILYIRPNLALAYAGDVLMAGEIAKEIRNRVSKDERLRLPEELALALPSIARQLYLRYSFTARHLKRAFLAQRIRSVSLILGGISPSGEVELWAYHSPFFRVEEIKDFEVIGSGSLVKPYLEENYKKIDSSYNDLKSKADTLITGLDAELSKHGIDTVGGLFQIIMLSSKGIQPLRYGFMDIQPESSGYAKSIELKKGKWIQKDEVSKEETKLIEPSGLNRATFIEKQFHDYKLPDEDKKIPKWYISYFIICLGVDRKVGNIEFNGVLSQFGAFSYPKTIQIIASLGFWGSVGENELEFRLEKDGEVKSIHSTKISTKYMPEIEEIDIPLSITVESPGTAFLECLINKQLIARKAIYFGKSDFIPNNEKEFKEICKNYPQQLIEESRQQQDLFLKEKHSVVEYFILCQDSIHDKFKIKFINEMKAVYWEKYPLNLRVFIASAYRMAKGKHNIRIDLVNAATRYTSNITNTAVENSSDFLVTPISGEMLIKIPEPGLYFFNVYVDDRFVTSVILPAETSKAQYSYSLPEEAEKEIASGEFIILLKRSTQNQD